MTVDSPRVFVVDDDPAVLRALRRLLNAADIGVETFESAQAFLDRVHPEGPACLLVDQRMPGLTGLELQEAIQSPDGVLSVVFMTGYGDVPTSVKAMKAGAVDFLVKPVDENRLLEAVKTALRQSAAALTQASERSAIEQRMALLTPRERQVCGLVVQGLLNKQIAARLGASEKTIKKHRARVMAKLAVGSVAELVRLTERRGVLGSPQSNL